MVCTQDQMHYEPVVMAMEKGYHVLCEKPMSPDKEEIIKMGENGKKIQPDSVCVSCASIFPVLFQIKRTAGRGQNR